MSARSIVVLLLAFLLLILAIQNLQAVTLRFLFWKGDVALIVVILLSFLVGFVLGLLQKPRQRKKKQGQ